VRRVVIGGVSYACPFEPLFRPLSAEEGRTLEESIAENGVQYRVKVCRTPGWGNTLIDGEHRALITARLKLPCPKDDLGELPDELAALLAVELNAGRRQLSPGELEQKRRDRVDRVAAARRAGKSLRAIADEVGVGESQVRRDLEAAAATAPGGAVDPEGGTVKGKDGRNRKARRDGGRPKAPRSGGAKALDAALRHARGLSGVVPAVLADDRLGPLLREAAAKWQIPVHEGGDCWPVLLALDGALSEAAGGPAGEAPGG